MVAYNYNPGKWEAEAEDKESKVSLGLHSKTVSKNKTKTTKNKPEQPTCPQNKHDLKIYPHKNSFPNVHGGFSPKLRT
jgi:hypothetical protein